MPINLISAERAERIAAIAKDGIDLQKGRLTPTPKPFWAGLRALGSELWLDTGDIEAANPLYSSEFTALTTNNTLLNKEVQKGIYDELIQRVAGDLSDLDMQTRVIEIAFILNARHGLRLAQRFGGKISVELHTDLANDAAASLAYGRRYFAICPEHFIIKIPLTPAGLIAMRNLRAEGIPDNFTLGFSARQNYLAAAFAKPSYVNVFLGRLNAYVADNKLGDGRNVGEKAMLASQRAVTKVSGGATKHIAASLRGAQQIADLAGVDVFTIPTAVAASAIKELDGTWRSRLGDDPAVTWASGVDAKALRSQVIWDISPADAALATSLTKQPPRTAEELVERARGCQLGDLFPAFTAADNKRLSDDGKIAKHAAWAPRIANGEMAIDSLLTASAFYSFTADQAQLDERIRKYMVGSSRA